VEKLEPEMSSSEISAALFELELTGKVRQAPGKNFVESF
jgi:DNA processing protein